MATSNESGNVKTLSPPAEDSKDHVKSNGLEPTKIIIQEVENVTITDRVPQIT